MIQISIVEDQPTDRDLLVDYFTRFEKETGKQVSFSLFQDGESFLAGYDPSACQMVLLDIDLGKNKENGLEVAKKLREKDPNVLLIFMTNLAQYAIAGYQVQAVDYILKPITYWDFSARIGKALARFEKTHRTKVIVSGFDNRLVVEVRNIYYIEVDNHKLIYHTKTGDYPSYGSLKEISNEFEECGFAKCNSCFLVNLSYVEKVEGYDCYVAGHKLLISHPKRKDFLDALNRYLSES